VIIRRRIYTTGGEPPFDPSDYFSLTLNEPANSVLWNEETPGDITKVFHTGTGFLEIRSGSVFGGRGIISKGYYDPTDAFNMTWTFNYLDNPGLGDEPLLEVGFASTSNISGGFGSHADVDRIGNSYMTVNTNGDVGIPATTIQGSIATASPFTINFSSNQDGTVSVAVNVGAVIGTITGLSGNNLHPYVSVATGANRLQLDSFVLNAGTIIGVP
jgi:hypothetical protein